MIDRSRSTQDLLEERRANINEWRRELDPTACANIKAHLALIDAELARRGFLTTDQLVELDRDLAEHDARGRR